MMASYYSTIYPSMGDLIGTKGFAAVVLGGAGSIPGAMIGGLAFGVIECLAGAIFSAQVREAAAFIVLIAVLLVKPLRYSRKGGRQRMKADFFRSNYKKILVALLFLLWLFAP